MRSSTTPLLLLVSAILGKASFVIHLGNNRHCSVFLGAGYACLKNIPDRRGERNQTSKYSPAVGGRRIAQSCGSASHSLLQLQPLAMSASSTANPPYLHLSCPVQCYAWGKVGGESQVAQLKSSAEPVSFIVDEEQTYAEVGQFQWCLWCVFLFCFVCGEGVVG